MFGHNATFEEIAVRLADENTALRSARHFPPNLAGGLIFSQSDKDSVPEQRLVGPTENVLETVETAKELRAALDRVITAAEFEEAEVRGKGAWPRDRGHHAA
jgi:hypothetical protein